MSKKLKKLVININYNLNNSMISKLILIKKISKN